ncbi:hypothetical protein [Labrys sp. ZIDIC5]|uniref:hypothetical protein n=1 Tax=Labrys sedimenti TaxID=3106036 RepID=UPI002ACA3FAF|nr:hypothetical protein [Labrys sp. ZIDIC5]MDZ5448984.1 hypothetical protein [Labrys sp. ZIDIC5]
MKNWLNMLEAHAYLISKLPHGAEYLRAHPLAEFHDSERGGVNENEPWWRLYDDTYSMLHRNINSGQIQAMVIAESGQRAPVNLIDLKAGKFRNSVAKPHQGGTIYYDCSDLDRVVAVERG